MSTCPSCGHPNAEGARFCSACGTVLTAASAEVRKTVTIVRCDVTGSTALGEQLDPEALRRVLTRYFEEMGMVIERHGGTVEKFIGDAVMGVFGIPQLHEDDALRAVRAGCEMREALADLNEELERGRGVRLEVRTGITTGEVIAGDASQGQAFVTGDAANVAARLETSAQPGEILIGEPTYRLVTGAVEAEPVEPLVVKGKVEPLRAWRLHTVRPGAEAIARRLETPLVGRRAELDELLRLYADAIADRACKLVTIVGEPGIGKSRLAEELGREVAAEAQVLRGRCLPYGEGITYWPIVEIVRNATGDDMQALADALAGDPDAALIADRVAAVVGASDAAVTSDEIFWAVRKLLERLARERPLIVLLDDVQWAEPTLFDLLEHVAYLSRVAPILLVCLSRPELVERRPSFPGVKLQVQPLSRAESESLMGELLAGLELESAIRTQIAAAAEGNPLFVEQMLAMIESDGDAPDLAIPPTIQVLLAARLDRLPSGPRAVIDTASVIGQEFWTGAVGALSPNGSNLTPALMELVRQELIRPTESSISAEDAFAFVHILVRDAAYAALPKELRATLHERFADWIALKDAERGLRHDEIVGYHLEQAYKYGAELGPPDFALGRRAGSVLADAGRRASLRGDTPAAVNLLSRAAELLPQGDELREGLLPDLATALMEAGELGRAGSVLEEASRSTREIVAARAAIQLWVLRTATEPDASLDEAETEARSAIEVFQRHADHWGLARAWLLLGEIANGRAQRREMGEAAARSAEHARLAGDPRAEAEALRLFGGALVYGPVPADEGAAELERLLSREDLNPMIEAALSAPLAALKGMQEEFGEARRLLDRARRIYGELGLAFQQARLGFMSGRVERLAGDVEQAIREFSAGCDLFREMGERGRYAGMALELGNALCDVGRLDEAESLFDEVEQFMPDAESELVLKSARGKLLAYRDDPTGAELARAGAAQAAETDDLTYAGDAFDRLAAILFRLGRPGGAADAANEALSVHRAKHNVAAARRMEALLSEIETETLSERD